MLPPTPRNGAPTRECTTQAEGGEGERRGSRRSRRERAVGPLYIGPVGRWAKRRRRLSCGWTQARPREGVMEMYWLKACPRCRGDLHEEKDFFGAYVACIQCGYVVNSREEEALRLTGILEREAAA